MSIRTPAAARAWAAALGLPVMAAVVYAPSARIASCGARCSGPPASATVFWTHGEEVNKALLDFLAG